MSRELVKALGPLARRLRLMASRAVLSLISDAPGVQVVQVRLLDGEVRGGIERMQNYGFTSVPLPGAEGVYLSLGGDRDHGVVIVADDRRYRVKGLAAGEVAIYDDQGQKIVLYRDRIEVEGAKIVVKGDDVHLGAEGGPRVARIGDRVEVGSGSSAGLWPIVEGSDKVSCA